MGPLISPRGVWDTTLEERDEVPENKANILSKWTFWWVNGLMLLGNRRPLVQEDLWDMGPSHSPQRSFERMESTWIKQQCQSESPSVLIALLNAFWGEIAWPILPRVVKTFADFVGPVLLGRVILFATDPSISWWWGVLYLASIVAALVTRSLCVNRYWHLVIQSEMHVRAALMGLIYEKVLRISQSAKQSSSTGEIINLMSNDVKRIQDVISFIHFCWSMPLVLVITFVLLWFHVGLAIVGGFGVLVLLLPLQMYLTKKLQSLRKDVIAATDARVKLFTEVVQAIRAVKLYALESYFQSKTSTHRDTELRHLLKYNIVKSLLQTTYELTAPMLSFATIVVFILMGNALTATTAFTVLTMYALVRWPLQLFAEVVSALVETRVSFKRMNDFMRCEEVEGLVSSSRPVLGDVAIKVENGSFAWTPHVTLATDDTGAESSVKGNNDEHDDEVGLLANAETDSLPTGREILHNIDLSVRSGYLIMVCGRIGSGKSSLLNVLLGELYATEGSVDLCGNSAAYIGEYPWLLHATLRDNVLFGEDFDKEWYDTVLEACGLLPDLRVLPGGDMVEVGERGITLSGGQKQRISLARAVYARKDVYLMDDPLSALDAHVGKHVFDRCIQGLLAGKTRVLVTHHLQYLPHSDYVVVLEEGRVQCQGPYEALLEAGLDFSAVLEEHGFNSEGKEGESIDQAEPTEPDEENEDTHGDVAVEGSDRADDGQLVQEEGIEKGTVSYKVYLEYFRAGSGWLWALALTGVVVAAAAQLGRDYWLAYWSKQSETEGHVHNDIYLGLYSTIVLTSSLLVFVRLVFVAFGGWLSGKHLHKTLTKHILRAPVLFFDTTPAGRVLARISSDMDTIDRDVPNNVRTLASVSCFLLSVVVVVLVTTPYFAIAVPFVGLFFYFIQRWYRNVSRELKRLNSLSKSPMFAHISESMDGVVYIRSFGQQARFIDLLRKYIDCNQRSFYLNFVTNRWLGLRLDLGSVLALALAISVVYLERGNISAEMVGFSLAYLLTSLAFLAGLVRNVSALENSMNSPERVLQYTRQGLEADPIIEGNRPPKHWPDKGAIQWRDVKLRYRDGLPYALKGITCDMYPREKVGICGRTGAGKSSLLTALFRLCEFEGTILIDGIDVSTIGLEDLRSRIAVIPQDPLLFEGTLRFNLDPSSFHSDSELLAVLERAGLSTLPFLTDGLDTRVASLGENLSAGERQLICIARALLQRSHVLILDEATAGVDMETDTKIRGAIREQFADCTVLTIAHRLSSLLDSDRVLVMDDGRILEFNTPEVLLADPCGAFSGMVQQMSG